MMPQRETLRRGWCPGALTPMQTGDGLLMRVRPRGGGYRPDQLLAIAAVAGSYGNGWVDATNRANLQIRGLQTDFIAKAQDGLAAVGLIDQDPRAEAVRNVVVSPLAGLDPDATDVRPQAAYLEAALCADRRLHALPGKFGFAIDGGGRWPLGVQHADINLHTAGDQTAITLAGDATLAAVMSTADGVAAALALAHAFVDAAHADPTVRRMRDLVAAAGAAQVFAAAGLSIRPARPAPAVTPRRLPVGLLSLGLTGTAVGAGLAYGRIAAAALASLAKAARSCGADIVRLSPDRIFIIAAGDGAAAPLEALARSLGLILEPGDPRLAMNVCPGAPACARGTTPTRADADAIAAVLAATQGRLLSVHVSGCEKGCAHRGSSDLTLVADAGLYRVIANGTVWDPPALTGVPGERLAEAIAALTGGHRG